MQISYLILFFLGLLITLQGNASFIFFFVAFRMNFTAYSTFIVVFVVTFSKCGADNELDFYFLFFVCVFKK